MQSAGAVAGEMRKRIPLPIYDPVHPPQRCGRTSELLLGLDLGRRGGRSRSRKDGGGSDGNTVEDLVTSLTDALPPSFRRVGPNAVRVPVVRVITTAFLQSVGIFHGLDECVGLLLSLVGHRGHVAQGAERRSELLLRRDEVTTDGDVLAVDPHGRLLLEPGLTPNALLDLHRHEGDQHRGHEGRESDHRLTAVGGGRKLRPTEQDQAGVRNEQEAEEVGGDETQLLLLGQHDIPSTRLVGGWVLALSTLWKNMPKLSTLFHRVEYNSLVL